jgi:hypothetical protein
MTIDRDASLTGPSEADFFAALDRIRERVGGNPVAEWEERYGEPTPQSLDDWVRWAVRIGWDGNYVRSGSWNPIELFRYIEGHLQRLRDHREVRAGDEPSVPPTGGAVPVGESGDASPVEPSAPFIFRRRGDDWNIRFDGGPLFAVNRLV